MDGITPPKRFIVGSSPIEAAKHALVAEPAYAEVLRTSSFVRSNRTLRTISLIPKPGRLQTTVSVLFRVFRNNTLVVEQQTQQLQNLPRKRESAILSGGTKCPR